MLTEEQRSILPIIHKFKCDNFQVRFELTYNEQYYELFLIELQHIEKQHQVHLTEIDSRKMEQHHQLRFFERPSNLYMEMVGAIDSLKISEYGEIQFYMNFGKSSKIPVIIYVARKGIDMTQYLAKDEQMCQKIQNIGQLHSKNTEKTLEFFKTVADLNRSKINIVNQKIAFNRVYLQHQCAGKYAQSANFVKSELINALKKANQSPRM